MYTYICRYPRSHAADVDIYHVGILDLTLSELATSHENRRAVGMLNEPYARQKMKARTGGERGRHLWPRLVQKKIAEGQNITSYELKLERESDDFLKI